MRNMKKNLKVRVFISCGQQKDTDEVEVAHKVAEKHEKNIGAHLDEVKFYKGNQ